MTKIIQFPGAKAPEPSPQKPVFEEPQIRLMDGTPASVDQQKAIGIILSGATFICIGIEQPASGGADFFTACHGDEGYLRNAEDHLPGVIHRLFVRKGIVS